MANYSATLETQIPREEAFAYLSDFSNTEEWDPGTVQAERIGEGPIGEGSEFRLVAAFLGRETALTYRVVEHEPPNAVSFRGENSTVISLDRVTIVTAGTGTRITYDARLTLKGPLKLADPLLALAFKRVGDRALAGMRDTLARKQAEMGARVSVSERS
ncbi:MAG TPA: SRPBCC family protein [Solirubrobacteraceae bacterium]|nr:SRPBCC family protein [Solirubrobacteraceae bacterium]